MKLSPRTRMVLAAAVLILPALVVKSASLAEDKTKDESAAPWRLATDARGAELLQAVADYIRDEDWKTALLLLQHLLDGQPDNLACLAGRKGKAERIVSVHTEAERLLASLPEAVRKTYQHTYGPRATDLLEKARQTRDAELFSRIVERYLYTDAGPAALRDLARRYARDGRLDLAALAYVRLVEHVGPARWSNEDLYQAAVAFHHRGLSARSDQILKQLLARNKHTLIRLGKRKLTMEELRKEIERAASPPRRLEWPLYRGDAARSNSGVGELPLLQPLWRRSMFYERDGAAKPAQKQIRQAEKELHDRQEPIIPAFSPLAVTVQQRDKKRTLLLCKNYFGIEAIDLRDGSLGWLSSSNLGLQRLLDALRGGSKPSTVARWLNWYQKQHPQILFENSTIGTLSTDGEFVYAVEDLAVTPMPPQDSDMGLSCGRNEQFPDKDLQEAVAHSRLFAFSLARNGKLTWELPSDEKGPLEDCYFLGPPLPLDGLLYMLIQKKKQVSLVCIDPKTKKQQIPQASIVFEKPLVEIATSLLEDPIRRTRAAHLAYADGILVCPTNAGVLLGVDLLSRRLAWVYPYLDKDKKPPDDRPSAASNANPWKTTAPVLADGKVVFAPPDVPSIHCLNLADGSLLWSRKKSRDDAYFAGVYDGKVLIVGIRSMHALSLTTGDSLWTRETGLPSGEGVAAGERYYLPLQRGAQSKQPEILVLDLAKGQVIAHAKPGLHTETETPGNLVFVEGKLISQSLWEIVAYPRWRDKANEVDECLKRNPDDSASLIERATIRRAGGDLNAAIEDLRTALRNRPSTETRQRARDLLYAMLTELFQHDLRAGERYLKEYKELIEVDLKDLAGEEVAQGRAEHHRRQISYYSILARLRESQGSRMEALQAYLDLNGILPSEEMLPLPGEPAVKVRLDLWVHGRIADLLKKATPEERKQLEMEMEHRLKEVRDRKIDDSLRGFLELAGVETAAGREARFLFAERLVERHSLSHFLETELYLLQVRDQGGERSQSARAVEMLARLMTARGLLPDAVYFYRLLRRDFGKIVLPGGKTGADAWDALTVDKRFLPYLTESDAFAARHFKARKQTGNFAAEQPVFVLEQSGEELPFYRHHRPGLGVKGDKFHLQDRRNGADFWTANSRATSLQSLLPQASDKTGPRFWYHTQGHLLVVPVENRVFGIDVIDQRILWQKDTPTQSAGAAASVLTFDPLDGSPRLVHPDGWIQFPEQNLVLGASVLCLVSQTGLHGCDPLTGRLLWTRSDLPRGVRLFGDAEYVFAVEENEKGEAISTHVLRLADGGTVAAPDFTAPFAQRVQIHGRTLVLSHTNDKGAVMLRLYNIPTGTVAWERTFAPGTHVMRSEEPGFAGVVEPNGKVHIVAVVARKEVMTGQIAEHTDHLRKVRRIHLLADDRNFYLALSAPTGDAGRKESKEATVPWYDLGRTGVPVNGMLYAFTRAGGNGIWYISLKNQRVVREQLRELPLLFLTSYSRRIRLWGADEQLDLSLSALCIQKSNGKVIYNDTMKDGKPFYAVHADPQTGTIEYVGPKAKIVCQPDPRRNGK